MPKYEFEYVYLLQVYPANNVPVYKYGKTTRAFLERYKEYSKVSPKIILVLSCLDCATLEKVTLKEIRTSFIMRNDLGKEYFEGPLEDITRLVINKYREHVRKQRNQQDNDCDIHLREYSMKTMNDEEIKELCKTEQMAEDLAGYAIESENRMLIRKLYDNGYNIFGEDYSNYFGIDDHAMKFFLTTMMPDHLFVPPSVASLVVADKLVKHRLSSESVDNLLKHCIEHFNYDLFKSVSTMYNVDVSKFIPIIDPIDHSAFIDESIDITNGLTADGLAADGLAANYAKPKGMKKIIMWLLSKATKRRTHYLIN